MGARRSYCAALIAVLAASAAWLGAGVGAASAESRVAGEKTVAERTASVQAVVKGRSVKLRGTTRQRRAKVTIHRWSSNANRWKRVAQVRSRNHRYQATVRQTDAAARYRFIAPKQSTQVKQVRLPKVSDACGLRPAKSDGTLWACSFVDEFNGTSLDTSKWIPQVYGYATGSEQAFACYSGSPENVAVRNGALQLTLVKRDAPALCSNGESETRYWSGMVSTYERFSQTYGRFEARIKSQASKVPGLHEAFWLYVDPRYTNGLGGEIDIMETYSSHPNLAIPYLHYDSNPEQVTSGPNQTTSFGCTASRGTFHTYRLEWTATKIQIFVDDRLCLTNTSGDAAFRQNFMVAFTQALGGPGNEPTSQTPLPATMSVDWVRVWK
ncbi:family 16 glycosylhydrolase [Nocardioides sp. Bht2]|uniref:glycoside hydrolase family 16 protein n=1 Tax=Nocardioides sp. Bht2 TaxID=3392297 RepID=UPI0039B41750